VETLVGIRGRLKLPSLGCRRKPESLEIRIGTGLWHRLESLEGRDDKCASPVWSPVSTAKYNVSGQLPKLHTRVRFPSPAPIQEMPITIGFSHLLPPEILAFQNSSHNCRTTSVFFASGLVHDRGRNLPKRSLLIEPRLRERGSAESMKSKTNGIW
jgi:hypothetical protein